MRLSQHGAVIISVVLHRAVHASNIGTIPAVIGFVKHALSLCIFFASRAIGSMRSWQTEGRAVFRSRLPSLCIHTQQCTHKNKLRGC